MTGAPTPVWVILGYKETQLRKPYFDKRVVANFRKRYPIGGLFQAWPTDGENFPFLLVRRATPDEEAAWRLKNP